MFSRLVSVLLNQLRYCLGSVFLRFLLFNVYGLYWVLASLLFYRANARNDVLPCWNSSAKVTQN